MKLQDINQAIQVGHVRITEHADEEAEIDALSFDEIYFSVLHGEIIEEYSNDKPYPSCLIYGQTFNGDHVHSVWAYNDHNNWAVIITVYRPDPNMWINWRKRRKKS